MARDEEFRKVAEDIGALARSLGRDFREAVDQARRGGYPPGRAVRHGLRGISDEARRGLRTGWSPPYRHHHGRPWSPRGYGSGYGGRGPWGWSPPPAPDASSGESGQAGSPFAGPPTTQTAPGWMRDGQPWPGPPGGPGGPGGPVVAPWSGAPSHRSHGRRSGLPPVRHRWDATTVAGMLAVLFGVAWLISATSPFHFSIEGVVAVGLMLLGASLIVTGRTDWSLSRRSWPVWLGLGLIAILVATSSTFGLGGALNSVSFGTKTVTVAQGAPLPTGTIHGGFGKLTVDLSAVSKSGDAKIVSVAGQTIIKVPENGTLNVDARVVGGQICVNGRDVANGFSAQDQKTYKVGNTDNNSPTLTLRVRQMFGQITIGQGC